MDQYKNYLAVNVLNEERIVNYRLLSRALKVHVDLAKRMLYDFHHTQNVKKSNSVHATYLLTGRKRSQPNISTNGVHAQEGEDSVMQSSPFPSSAPQAAEYEKEQQPDHATTVTLVREEELEEVKSQYDELFSIFVYSLGPGTINDLQVLGECNRRVRTEYMSEDPLEAWARYGVIQNPNVRRRSKARPPPYAASALNTSSTKPPGGKEALSGKASAKNSDTEDRKDPKLLTKDAPSVKPATKPGPRTVRRESSDLFKSFAKAKPPKPKANDSAAATPTSLSRETSKAEDEEMKDVNFSDEDEGEDADDIPLVDPAKAEAARKEREERQAKLRQMMEDDDEDEVMADVPAPDEGAEDGSPLDTKPRPPEIKQEVTEDVQVEGARRRGRRKVMKKKTVQDEDGYLVTTEEPGWESFSEEEPEVKKSKPPLASSFGASKGKKAAKGAQGNIMNFFKKG